jgi:hypothetical protein
VTELEALMAALRRERLPPNTLVWGKADAIALRVHQVCVLAVAWCVRSCASRAAAQHGRWVHDAHLHMWLADCCAVHVRRVPALVRCGADAGCCVACWWPQHQSAHGPCNKRRRALAAWRATPSCGHLALCLSSR